MNTGLGSHSRLQGIFPTQGLNPGLPHCRLILYYLSHQGSPWQHTCTLYWCCIILGLLSYDTLQHLTWYHHQTIFKRTCVPLILGPMYWQSTVKKQKSLNVFITKLFTYQGNGQAMLVEFVNSDGKIKTIGQTPPKVTRIIHMESLPSLLGTWTCSFMLTRFHALAFRVSRYWFVPSFSVLFH